MLHGHCIYSPICKREQLHPWRDSSHCSDMLACSTGWLCINIELNVHTFSALLICCSSIYAVQFAGGGGGGWFLQSWLHFYSLCISLLHLQFSVGHRLTHNALRQNNKAASGCCNCLRQSHGLAFRTANMPSLRAPVLLEGDKALFEPAETKGRGYKWHVDWPCFS